MLLWAILLGTVAPVPTNTYLSIWQIPELQMSPDGSKIAFVAREPMTEKRHENIWIADTKAGDAKQFTTWTGDDHNARFSADSRYVYFLSNRSGSSQIYKISLDGGEATLVLPTVKDIEKFELSPDGLRIAYSAATKEAPKDDPDPQVIDTADVPTGVFVAELASPKPKIVPQATVTVSDFSWAGKRLLVRSNATPTGLDLTDQFSLIDPETGKSEDLKFISPAAGSALAGANGAILWTAPRIGLGPDSPDMFFKIGASNPTMAVQPKLEYTFMPVSIRPDGTAYGQYVKGLDVATFEMSAGGECRFAPSEGVTSAIASPVAGKRAYVHMSPSQLFEVYYQEGDRPARQVSHINDGPLSHSLAPAQRITYKSFDGKPIEAILTLPSNLTPGKLPPLIVSPHGGPTGQYFWGYDIWAQFFASRGYAVLSPNVRGSTGYGWDFMISNKADWGGGDYKDMMSGVDAVIGKGLVDPNKVAIAGWSYGGYMSAWAVTQTNRFKAAVIGAPMTNLISEYGTERLDTHQYDTWFHGRMYDNFGDAVKQSPITFVKNVHTPCLLLQGAEDNIDPPGQSFEFYRALKHYGVEVQMALYPKEPHGFTQPKHRVDMLERMVSFIDAHMK